MERLTYDAPSLTYEEIECGYWLMRGAPSVMYELRGLDFFVGPRVLVLGVGRGGETPTKLGNLANGMGAGDTDRRCHSALAKDLR